MTRSILSAVASSILLTVVLGSGGCTASGVGDPCTPEEEYDPTFQGFDAKEVNVESRSFQCQTRLCLVNHFQGRVSCPYGQSVAGTPPSPLTTCAESQGGATAPDAGCCIPGVGAPVTGNPLNTSTTTGKAYVPPQCIDRQSADAVYCSCRCANINGDTNDGANYCKCPTGFNCEQLVSSIGAGDTGLTGAYCVKQGTDYDMNSSCMGGTCDPKAAAGTPGYCGAAPGLM
jgi:hypothetical protein